MKGAEQTSTPTPHALGCEAPSLPSQIGAYFTPDLSGEGEILKSPQRQYKESHPAHGVIVTPVFIWKGSLGRSAPCACPLRSRGVEEAPTSLSPMAMHQWPLLHIRGSQGAEMSGACIASCSYAWSTQMEEAAGPLGPAVLPAYTPLK